MGPGARCKPVTMTSAVEKDLALSSSDSSDDFTGTPEKSKPRGKKSKPSKPTVEVSEVKACGGKQVSVVPVNKGNVAQIRDGDGVPVNDGTVTRIRDGDGVAYDSPGNDAALTVGNSTGATGRKRLCFPISEMDYH